MPVEQGRLYSIKQSNCQISEQDGFHIRKVMLNTPQKSSVWLRVSKNLRKLDKLKNSQLLLFFILNLETVRCLI